MYQHRILIMVYLVAVTTVTLESSDSGASSVEDSAMDVGSVACTLIVYYVHCLICR